MRRVVVTGLGAVSPCGNDVPTTWSAMVEGRSGIGPITRFDTTGWPVRIAGEVRGFDAEALLGKKEVRRTERFIQFAIAAAEQAAKDADLTLPVADGDQAGVYVGSGIGGLDEIYRTSLAFVEGGHKVVSPFFIPRSLVNLAAGHIAIRLGARGPSLAPATACAVGNHSIGEAWRALRSGEADIMVAGGTEAALVPIALAGFASMKALSRRNDDPARASRPFDRDRDGFVLSEGAAVLVLEALEHATARGARIYAEIVGYGLTNDAYHLTAPPPDGSGAARCMERALASARIAPQEVEYVNAHGTSTEANDVAETRAIHAVFGSHAPRLMVSSTKSVTGHLLGAAGGIEAIATVLALHHGVIPPTATLENADPECDLDYVPGCARPVPIRVAISNAFGFGGTNSTLVFRRFDG